MKQPVIDNSFSTMLTELRTGNALDELSVENLEFLLLNPLVIRATRDADGQHQFYTT